MALAAIGAGACFGTGTAFAQACITAVHNNINIGPQPACPPLGPEVEIFLQETHGATTVLGNVGSQGALPLVEFTSGDALDGGSGNATITPHATGHNAAFHTLDITIPGRTFTDFAFQLSEVNVPPLDLTVKLLSGSTVVETAPYTAGQLMHDANTDFNISDPAGLTEIQLSSTSGLKDVRSFDVSGVSTPEPSTWAMMVLGLVGVGLAAPRRTGRWRLRGAMA